MQSGAIIENRYQLTQPLQSAWLARNLSSGQPCLLKPRSSFLDPLIAEWLGRVWHPGLPRLLEQIHMPGQDDCYVFEYMAGKPLSDFVTPGEGRMDLQQLLPLMIQAARILAFLHQQSEQPVLHLDVKADNLIVSEQSDLYLIDFGAAIFYRQPENLTGNSNCPDRREALACTMDYAAPEHLAGQPCPGSDLFSLGLTFLHLLTGLPPGVCRSQPLRELLPDLPAGLHRLFGRCLNTDPKMRYANAEELASDLQQVWECPEPLNAQPAVRADPIPVSPAGLAAPLVCVWGNADFGCELAAVYAETRQVLVVDADLLNPRADLLLGLKQQNRAWLNINRMTGLDLLLNEEQSGHLDISLLSRLVQTTQIKRLSALTTQASLEYYEYYHLDSLNQVLKLARLVSDLVIVLCSRFIYDAFTSLCLLAADKTLVPLAGDSGSFRECNRAAEFLFARHRVDCGKLNYIAFPYHGHTDLSWGTLDELCGGRLAGCVSDRDRRRSMKNGATPYAAALDRVNRQEYLAIIRRINLASPGKGGMIDACG